VSRLTFRARLTLAYGGLFLVAGFVLLGLTYVLVGDRGTSGFTYTSADASSAPGEQGAPLNQVVDDRDALGALLTRGGIALVVVGVAAAGFVWLLAGRLLRPINRITETAVRIAGAPDADRGLHERIALSGPRDEVKQLADAFDMMLERLDHAFDGQRRFVANASHELRTPLTVNRSLLEVALYRGETTPEFRQLGETLLEVNSRHERLLDGLLVLARSEREVTDQSYVDLADVVEHVVSQTPAGSAAVECQAAEAPTSGNAPLLERLVQNLVDNAIRYNVPSGSGWVSVVCGPGPDGSVFVRVTNTGPVIPRYDVPTLFEPFRRHNADRLFPNVPGAGLGLSIVQAISHAHGGDVQAEPRTGGGLVVTVTLPAA
jgi:signal transduction histidine kinase